MTINHRRLPKPLQRSREFDLESLHGEKPASLKLMPKYERFSTVCHSTDLKKAKRIIEDGGITNENSRCYSPLANKLCEIKGVAFVPNTERSVEDLKSTSSNSKNLYVKWLIGTNGDSGELIKFLLCDFS